MTCNEIMWTVYTISNILMLTLTVFAYFAERKIDQPVFSAFISSWIPVINSLLLVMFIVHTINKKTILQNK